jgi:hypothetical protein
VNAILRDVDGLVGVAAENPVSIVLARVLQRSRGHFRRHAEPARIQPVDQPHDGLAFKIEFLQLQINRCAKCAEPQIAYLEAVELMAVDRDVAKSGVLPCVVLVDADSHQVRHDVGEPVVVIAFDPHDLDIALGIRELANVAEELPVVLGETGEVEVGKDIAQQDQALKAVFLKHARGFAGMAGLCTEVQVRKDQRVVAMQIHDLVVARQCYGVMKYASKSVQSSLEGNPSVNKGFSRE